MNDFAHVGLRALAVVRSTMRRHPTAALGAGGFTAATLTVVAGGQIGAPRSVIPLTSWLGLLSRNGASTGSFLPGTLMLTGIVGLLLLWLVALRIYRAGQTAERTVWCVAAAWGLPFVVGPPLLSNDVFTYAAQGLLQRRGLDPYLVGPAALGNVRALDAVDPSWRSVPSPYGPFATMLQHLAIAISGGSPLGAALVFRALGVACLVAIGVLAADLAGLRRVQALTLTVLNPLLLLHVVSAAHLDGVMCVLLLAAVVAAGQRRWTLGIVLAVAAGEVKAPAFVAVVAIIAAHTQRNRARRAWEVCGRHILTVSVCLAVVSLVVHDSWGWIHALNAPALGHTALAPASLLSDLLRPVVPGASFDDLAAGGRITALAAAGFAVAYLTMTTRHRALELTVGYGMLAVGVLSPVVYPWYLIGAVVTLAATARGARRELVLFVSGVGCVLGPPGFSSAVANTLDAAAIVVFAIVLGPRLLERYGRAPQRWPHPGAPEPVPQQSRSDPKVTADG